MKMSVRPSLISSAAFIAVASTVALGCIAFQYYKQQTDLLQFYRAEEHGAYTVQGKVEEIIFLSENNELETMKSRVFEIRQILDQEKLILDPAFQTYYLMNAVYYWLPSVFVTQQAEMRTFALHTIHESLNKTKDEELKTLSLQLMEKSSDPQAFRSIARSILFKGSSLFIKINKQRINAALSARLWSMLSSGFFWLCGLMLTFAAVRNVTKTRKSMLQLIHNQTSALEQSQALATLGEISASIGHDIANPLHVITLMAESLQRMNHTDDPAAKECLSSIRRMVVRINDIIHSMKAYLDNGRTPATMQVDMTAVFSDVQLLMRQKLAKHNVLLRFDFAHSNLYVVGHESELVQVFVNLISNAIDAVKNQSVREITVFSENVGGKVSIMVLDTGPGVPVECRGKIFEAFYSTKPSKDGIGLGLCISKKIVTKYGGDIAYRDQKTGACFEVTLQHSADCNLAS